MYTTTLCFAVRGEPVQQVLLGMKKTGFGRGKYNGFGGKLQAGESVAAAAVRELWEESGLQAAAGDLLPVGSLDFIFPAQPELDHDVHIFLLRNWQNEPQETEEMRPVWVTAAEVPYAEMWQDDRHWLPQVLAGQTVRGRVVFAANQEDVDDMQFTFSEAPDAK